MRLTNDGLQRRDVTRLRGELGPDLHPVTVLAINALTTDFNLDLLDEAVTNVRQPTETGSGCAPREGTARLGQINLGEHNLDVRLVHQIGVTVNHCRHTLVEIGLTVEGDFNGLHRKVGIALVQHLPEGNLGITGNVDILRTIRHELHQTTTHFVFMLYHKKKVFKE